MGAEYYLKNDDLREYFISLPPIVQDQIVVSGAEICTLGELMQVAEHLKQNCAWEEKWMNLFLHKKSPLNQLVSEGTFSNVNY